MIFYFPKQLQFGAGGLVDWLRAKFSPADQGPSVAGKQGRPGSRVLRALRPDRAYGISAFVGLLTYFAYGFLNDAWANPALFAIALYMFLCIPGYSKLSNRIEIYATRQSGLETAGRLCRYLAQLGVNLILLWTFLAAGILDPAGLVELGGFFATAAWVTIVSQGGQYFATWLARQGLGRFDINVVLAISTSAVVNALAVSGVPWIQPIYLFLSLSIGLTMLSFGMLSDALCVLRRGRGSWSQSGS